VIRELLQPGPATGREVPNPIRWQTCPKHVVNIFLDQNTHPDRRKYSILGTLWSGLSLPGSLSNSRVQIQRREKRLRSRGKARD